MDESIKVTVDSEPGAQPKGQKQQLPGKPWWGPTGLIEFNEHGITQGGKTAEDKKEDKSEGTNEPLETSQKHLVQIFLKYESQTCKQSGKLDMKMLS